MDPIIFWPIAFAATLIVLLYLFFSNRFRQLSEKLREQDAKFSLAMETLREAYWACDLMADNMFLSPAYIRLLGFDPTCLNQHYGIFDSLVHPEDRESVLSKVKSSIQQREDEFQCSFRIHSKHNGYRHVLFLSRISESDQFGKATKLVGSLADITELKTAENELLRRDQFEQHEVQYRSDFLATISHEIRTPMNAISGLSYLLLQSQLSEAQRNDISNIQQSSQTLLNTVNDVFELSQLESQQIQIEPREFHLYDIFEAVVNSFHFKTREKNIDFVFEIDDTQPLGLIGDPVRIGQILTHLTVKLIEFSGQSKFKIVVKPNRTDRKDSKLYFSINTLNNTGAKARETENHEIDPNQPSIDINNRYAQRGLNLAICRELMRLMEGKLEIGLEDHAHAYCAGQLPISTALNPSISKQFQYPRKFMVLNVLVVEPDPDLALSICRLLESFAIQSSVCDSHDKAVRTILGQLIKPHALVIIGSGLTPDQAIQTVEQIQSLPVPRIKPSVLCITNNDPSLEPDSSPYKSFLPKPLTPARLYKSITKLSIEQQSHKAGEPEVGASKNKALHKILLVEDNRVNQQVARELLEQLGGAVTIANHGLEAVKQLKRKNFDLVLMDIQMPEMDGLSATKEIRRNPNLLGMPIIAMTAHATQNDRDIALNAGMDDFITKPIDSYTLYRTLQRWIKRPILKPLNPGRPLPSKTSLLSKISPHLDTKTGLSHVNNNQSFYIKLLQEFHRDHYLDSDAIQQAFTRGDFDTAKRIVHTIMGIAANIGAKNLYQSSKTLYSAMHSNSSPDNTAVQDFNQSFSDLMSALKQTDRSNANRRPYSTAVKPDRSKVKEILAHMDILLRQGDSEALELMEKIKIHLDYFDIDDQVLELIHRINYFRFEDARRSLNKIATSLNINLVE